MLACFGTVYCASPYCQHTIQPAVELYMSGVSLPTFNKASPTTWNQSMESNYTRYTKY